MGAFCEEGGYRVMFGHQVWCRSSGVGRVRVCMGLVVFVRAERFITLRIGRVTGEKCLAFVAV